MRVTRVLPQSQVNLSTQHPPPQVPRLQRKVLHVRLVQLYNLGIWVFLAIALFAQSFGVIWSSVQTSYHLYYGQSPLDGKYPIPGNNDEPYSDRIVVCVKRGFTSHPIQLSQLLKQQIASRNVATTRGINGYRVVSRQSFIMDAGSFDFYVRQCNTLSQVLDDVFLACQKLGYNTTQDFLRVVDGLESDEVISLESVLPVLIIPFWDKGALSRYVLPGSDGSACMLRASGVFERDADTTATVAGVTRSVREARTEEMLAYPGGVWRNGWYEDPVVASRWYSDVISSVPNGEWGVDQRSFDVLDGARELDCSRPPYGCGGGISDWNWGDTVQMKVNLQFFHSIAISNGKRFGLFLFDALHVQTITSHYSLEKFISNWSFAVILARWVVAMIALSPTDTIGIGAVTKSRSFQYLPFFLLPRLKSTLEGFWSSGCFFDGDQHALTDAWFEIYPAIGEFVLLYFSLLNTTAKLLRRRMSDALFGPTLLFFVILHYFRFEIAATNFLEFDSRVVTIITAEDIESASILDFFTTDLAFRTNGAATSLFAMKLSVLGLNLLPLLLSRRCRPVKEGKLLGVEDALAIIFMDNGGLGSTASPYVDVIYSDGESRLIQVARPYEIVRAQHIVVGTSPSRLLMCVDHWFLVVMTAPFCRASPLLHRIVVFSIVGPCKQAVDASLGGSTVWTIDTSPQVITVSDPQLTRLALWQITAVTLR